MRKQKSVGYFTRERWIYFQLALIVMLILGRLVWMQVYQAETLSAKGLDRRMISQNLLPERGIIYDNKGNVLSRSTLVQEVYGDPRSLTQLISKHQYTKMSKDEIAQKLGSILGQDPKTILGKLNEDQQWVSFAHQVEIDKTDQIRQLKIPGIGFTDEQKRVYMLNSWASSVLGFVNMTGHGVGGIEAYYDKFLYGTPGFSMMEGDSNHQEILDTPSQTKPPQPGDNLTLTLNITIQSLIEQQLDDLEKATQAKSVTILAMDPKTGKILGMGARPTFDPNDYAKSSPDDWVNRAISMNYEPGSTFKIVTGSAALEEGVITPDEPFSDPGYLRVGPRIIENWDYGIRPAGTISFTQGMEQSSNVVLAQVGQKLGLLNFYKYLRAFGFGVKTGVDIAGEESGLLVPQNKARDVDLATMSFGQSNMVTPIQLMTAFCAVANGGTLYKPYVVDKITDPAGNIVQQNQPTVVRKVISKQTADQMTNVLEHVVTDGTGYLAAIPGINVAGKSGTAQKVDPKTGQYSTIDYISSFEAYAPAENPMIAVLVVVDSPKGGEHEGGPLCSPYAKTIIQGALQDYNIPVAGDTQNSVALTVNDTPVRPAPKSVTPERQPLADEAVVPDLTGMTIRQVGETLEKVGLHYNFNGSGLACQQSLPGGTVIIKGTSIDVKFSPLDQSP
ncbi:MAG: penicillin-binding transpeptidase domain-containing protein [Desulfosporosinus sp.]|nr:penicillin-binding transpeptidase domain-containing protein [Desulfosporosinus sp.]